MKCYSWTLDTVGLFAAGVRDLAHGLAAMTGRPELLPQASVPTPRIGVVTQDFAGAPEARRRGGVAGRGEGCRTRRRLGAHACDARDRRGSVAHASDRAGIRGASGAGLGIPRRITTRCRRCCAARLDESKGMTPADYDEARADREPRRRRALAKVFEDVDVLLTFSAPGAAPKGLALDRRCPLQPAVDADGRALRQRSRSSSRTADCRWACRSSRGLAMMRGAGGGDGSSRRRRR